MRTMLKSLLAASVVGLAFCADRPAAAQALAFNVSVPIAQPVYYYDPFYPAAYQTYFGYYYPTYNWFPATYHTYSYGAAVAPVASTSTYYYGYPYSFGYPYAFGYAWPYGGYGFGANYYGYPFAYNLVYGPSAVAAGAPAVTAAGWPYTTYYGYGATTPYFTGYYPAAYYGNYYPNYFGTGTYAAW